MPIPLAATEVPRPPAAGLTTSRTTASTITRTTPPLVGKLIPADTFDRLVARQQPEPSQKNLLVEMSRGIPTLAERMRERAAQRAQQALSLPPQGPFARSGSTPAPGALPSPPPAQVAAVAATPRPDLKALAAQVQASRAMSKYSTPERVTGATDLTPGGTEAPIARPSLSVPLVSANVAPSAGSPRPPVRERVQVQEKKETPPLEQAAAQVAPAEITTRRKRRSRGGPSRDELADLLR